MPPRKTQTDSSTHTRYLNLLVEAHQRSGLSMREVAADCDISHSYVIRILKGDRRPQRDNIIALGFAYRLERIEVDELLLSANLPPLGRSALREYRQQKMDGDNSRSPTSSMWIPNCAP